MAPSAPLNPLMKVCSEPEPRIGLLFASSVNEVIFPVLNSASRMLLAAKAGGPGRHEKKTLNSASGASGIELALTLSRY